MFMHKIFTQVVCINGNHPRYNLATGSWRELACAKLSQIPRVDSHIKVTRMLVGELKLKP